MSQLVGLPCALCNGRIATALEGRFCPGCACPVHLRCERPGARIGACAACGTPEAVAGPVRLRLQHQAEAARRDIRTHHLLWAILTIVGGVACVAISVALLLLTAQVGSRVVLWWGGILVGAAAILRGINRLWLGRPPPVDHS